MNKKYKHVAIAVMIVLSFVQIFCINKLEEEKKSKQCMTPENIKTHATLAEITEELNCLKGKEILSANKVNEDWHVKVKIKGDKEELLKELSKLPKYEITNFNINKNKDENSVVLELIDK